MKVRKTGLFAAVLLVSLSGLAQMPPNPTALSSALPADAPPKPNLSTTGDFAVIQRKFDIFAWQEFVALNWPPGKPGQPGPGTIGKSASGDNSTVWESYMAASQVFQPGAVPPASWGTTQPIPSFCPAVPATLKGKVAKVLPLIAKGDVQDEFTEAFTLSPLIDVNGKYTRYEVRINKVEFDKILQGSANPPAPAKPWYIPANQVTPINFPAGVYNTSQIGSVEVKAAWRQISQGEAGRYHTAWAYITYAPDPNTHLNTKCAGPLLMGLVGLHIAHKTASGPQWLWATFEHLDNAPSAPAAGHYSYYNNPKCTFSPACADQQPTAPSGGWDGDPTKTNTPVQVLRATPIPAAKNSPTTGINPVFQKLLRAVYPKSVWQYYQLVDTQWSQHPGTVANPQKCYHDPTNPSNPYNFKCNGPGIDVGPLPVPPALANTTLETYFQQAPGNSNAFMGSCMGCHSNGTVANGAPNTNLFSDFSFLLGDAQLPSTSPNPPRQLRRANKANKP
jgi:hypothetical protein